MSWVARTSPMGGDASSWVNDVAVSSTGVVVAVGASVNSGSVPPTVLVMRSTDGGVTWTEASSYAWDDPSSATFFFVTWSEFLGLFVGSSYSSSTTSLIATSPDGDVWTTIYTNNANISLAKPISCDGLGILSIVGTDFTGADSGTVLTTTNGVATTLHTGTNALKYPTRGAWSETDGVAVEAGFADTPTGKPLARSTDGINYAMVASPLDDAVSSVASFVEFMPTSGVWVATGVNDADGVVSVRSDDAAATWSETVPFSAAAAFPSGEVTDGRILMGGSPNGSISSDGALTWTRSPTNPSVGSLSTVLALPVDGVDLLAGSVGNVPFDVVMTGTPVRVVPPEGPGGKCVSPLWKYFIASLDGTGITDYMKLARDRVVEVVLNGPLSMRGGVPSDDTQVNLVYTDDGYTDAYLTEGTRLLWGFRRESDTSPYYTVRAATIITLLQDRAAQDDAVTAFQGWDPWHYLFSRPVCNADGSLPGEDGLSFTNTQASVVIATLLKNTIDNHGFAFIDAGTTYSGSSEYDVLLGDGDVVLETGAGMEIDINFPQGTSVGQAWQIVTNLGVCDIILEPVYAPAGRTVAGPTTVYNFLVQLNVYAQAGSVHDELIFAWDLPGRNLVGIDRLLDGAQRANEIAFQAGPGGVNGTSSPFPIEDLTSVTKYGEYWRQQFFPGVQGAASVQTVTSLATQVLALSSTGRQTVTFTPAPERSPCPWTDYNLGDRVPVWASNRFRQILDNT